MYILDTTLRDGSYAINFKFSLLDVRNICRGLEDSGVDYIEIGHGVGLNAGASQYEPALHTDSEYLIAAKDVVNTAKIGMFCIPGIARLRDLEEAADCGMDFVRIGTPVNEVELSRPFIEKARGLGLIVMANYMKSYTAEPAGFAEKVKLSETYGASCVYIVDSSGGMFSGQIDEYADAIHSVSDIDLGFHGHNNLGLAIANSINAAQKGFKFIDSSLQGLGRSSGNASTEQLAMCLRKLGMQTDIDIIKLVSVGYKYVYPFVESKGLVPLDTISGYSDFHSSYMHLIHKYSAKYSLNPLELIIKVCEEDKLDATDSMVDRIGKNMKKSPPSPQQYSFHKYHGREQN
jgi:4-hydroxy-2-oxovalerate aldolase